jgi:hypothetical protein
MNSERKPFLEHLADWLTWQRFLFSITLIFFLTSILFPFYWMSPLKKGWIHPPQNGQN